MTHERSNITELLNQAAAHGGKVDQIIASVGYFAPAVLYLNSNFSLFPVEATANATGSTTPQQAAPSPEQAQQAAPLYLEADTVIMGPVDEVPRTVGLDLGSQVGALDMGPQAGLFLQNMVLQGLAARPLSQLPVQWARGSALLLEDGAGAAFESVLPLWAVNCTARWVAWGAKGVGMGWGRE